MKSPPYSSRRLSEGVSRRTFVKGLAVGGAVVGLGVWREPAFAQGNAPATWKTLTGTDFDLRIGETRMNFTGSPRIAFTVNGSVPAPTLRWKEGDTVTLRVANTLDEDASIHWHGILLPANMDGVPGLGTSDRKVNGVCTGDRSDPYAAAGRGERPRGSLCCLSLGPSAGQRFEPIPHLMRRFYLVTRDLHLYIGLFLSPFVLVFAVSVFYVVHGLSIRPSPGASDPSFTVANVNVSTEVAKLQGRARVDALRPVLEQLEVHGEIDFVRHAATERRLIVPVRLPDRDSVVTIDYEKGTATVTSREHGIGDAVVYLHKMPGPHNADVRGNSGLIRMWRLGADATVYLLLFVTVSGIYLWAALKAERRVGLLLLLAGAGTFWGLVYAVAA